MSDILFPQLIAMIGQWRSHLTPMPEGLRFTQQQLEQLQLEVFGVAEPLVAGSRIIVFGISATIVELDEDSTFHQEQCIRAIDESWEAA